MLHPSVRVEPWIRRMPLRGISVMSWFVAAVAVIPMPVVAQSTYGSSNSSRVHVTLSAGPSIPLQSWRGLSGAAPEYAMNPSDFSRSAIPSAASRVGLGIPVTRHFAVDLSWAASFPEAFAIRTGRTAYEPFGDGRGVWCRVGRTASGFEVLGVAVLSEASSTILTRFGIGIGTYAVSAWFRPYAKKVTYTLTGETTSTRRMVAPVARAEAQLGRRSFFATVSGTLRLLSDLDFDPVHIGYLDAENVRTSVTVVPKGIPYAEFSVGLGFGIRFGR